MRFGQLIIAASALALCVGTADAATRALIVGVSGYPKLPERIRLTGPKNDSREVANTLARLGVPAADITVLADGVSDLAQGIANPGPGDKEAILDGLDRLAETSRPGDLVVFYFSGHGSQQPDTNGDEEGGADEIFLPYDVGGWSGSGVDNALVDDELGERIERILDKGVDFFGIIDACHSATGFRDIADDDTRPRGVDPADLGVPSATGQAGRALFPNAAKSGKEGRGRAAYFYAAQETEEALEKTPPNAEDGESYGVFTYNMLSRLNQTPGLTYRTLHQAVMADIKRNALMSTQTPELEGELLDEPVLGLTDAARQQQWPIFNGKLQAGSLEGLSAGAIVALLDDPTAGNDKALAYGVVETAGATRSLVVPVAYPCAAGETCAAPDEIAFKTGRFARLVEPGVDLGIALSEPIRVDPNDGEDYTLALDALKTALSSEGLSARVSQRAEGYDIAVALMDGKLAFSTAGGLIDRNGPGSSPRLTLPSDPDAAAQAVTEAIGKMAKATALQRLGGSGGAAKLGLVTGLQVTKSKVKPGPGESCSEDETAYETAAPVGDAPSFSDCDIVSITMANDGRKPLDVTVLLIGADFSITPVWPSDGDSNRIHTAEKKTVDLLQMEPNPKSAAEERLIFLAVPGVNKAHTAFTDLGQEGLRASLADETPETAALRDFLETGLNEMDRAATTQPPRIDEEMSIDITPFFVTKGVGG